MPEFVSNCPRCKAQKVTFDILADYYTHATHQWRKHYDVFSVCRSCSETVVFILALTDIHNEVTPLKVQSTSALHYFDIEGYRSIRDTASVVSPDHVPSHIQDAFSEGAACYAIGCHNACATMFRLCVDHATKDLLPEEDTDGVNRRIRRTLAPRLEWLFDNDKLPETLRDLSTCIREDGNDGAHDGSLSSVESADLIDFTVLLLERLYTEPARIRLARERRENRQTKDG